MCKNDVSMATHTWQHGHAVPRHKKFLLLTELNTATEEPVSRTHQVQYAQGEADSGGRQELEHDLSSTLLIAVGPQRF